MQPAVDFEQLKIDAKFLSISNQIDMNFAVKKAEFDASGFEKPRVIAEFAGKTYMLQPELVYVSDILCYVFSFENIPPQMMNENIKVSLTAEHNGECYIGETVQYSVASYAYIQLKTTTNEKFRTLLVDMLRYGSAAQVYTKYDCFELVDAGG